MLHKTPGIVLKTTNYAESSVVAKIYTEKFGLQSYMINGVKKPSAKIRMNMLQALSLLDMVVYHKQNGSIQRISEARATPLLQTIPYDIVKSSIGIFINEMLYKSLKQPAHEPQLFNFLQNAILFLDQTSTNCSNFSLVFLLKLTSFLGFNPDISFADTYGYFDLLNGGFTNGLPVHPHYLDGKYIVDWVDLLHCSLSESHLLKLNALQRRFLLSKIILYYSLHIENFGIVNSHLVLEEILS
jgi:DNA repair protein RecO (recombination protein O)